jgi:hypothetical protein
MTIERVSLADVRPLFERFHAYKGAGGTATYALGFVESGAIVAAFLWQPPAPGAALAVCPEAPYGVLALSRMVAVPRGERALRHISKPLRAIMRQVIDRGRWPVLVTYSDEGAGHTGHVYKCSDWHPTHRSRARVFVDAAGVRTSCYCAGGARKAGLIDAGHTFIQRWEHRVCAPGAAAEHVKAAGWVRQLTGKQWRSGAPAARWVRDAA